MTTIRVMVKLAPYAIEYDSEIPQQLDAIEPKYHSLIRAVIEEQLRFEPEIETRNRKPLRRPIAWGATWELRFGPDNHFRVFYRVDHGAHRVHVLAIGTKERSRLFVGGVEIRL